MEGSLDILASISAIELCALLAEEGFLDPRLTYTFDQLSSFLGDPRHGYFGKVQLHLHGMVGWAVEELANRRSPHSRSMFVNAMIFRLSTSLSYSPCSLSPTNLDLDYSIFDWTLPSATEILDFEDSMNKFMSTNGMPMTGMPSN